MYNFLQEKLNDRLNKGLYRELIADTEGHDFWSNDYLGFAKKTVIDSNAKFHGSGGSRLLAGNHREHEEAEKWIAEFHQAEAALSFSSGYMANLGLFSSIGDKDVVFLYDEYCHASMIDGMRMSWARRFKFKHNDTDALKNLLLKYRSNKVYVVTESVFSMDGDIAPLDAISKVCVEFNAALIVDEAHALGVFGDNAQGLCPAELNGMEVFARVYTFGKALGLHGAVVLGSDVLRNYLINFARPFIYSTALSPQLMDQIVENYKCLSGSEEQGQLRNIIAYFKEKAQETIPDNSIICNDSAIQIIFKGYSDVVSSAEFFRENGIKLKAILSPTVPQGTERLRICLHAFNTKGEIDTLFDIINKIKEK